MRLTPPTIECAEHVQDETLPNYPVGPTLSQGVLEALHIVTMHPVGTDPDANARITNRELAAILNFSSQQSEWAVSAAGIHKREVIRRRTTANCLDAYRAKGIIR